MITCGIDIESYDRVKRLYKRYIMPLGLFSECEQKHINSYQSATYAFTAKEAILKAFGSGWFNSEIEPHDIQLEFNDHDIPVDAGFSGKAGDLFKEIGSPFTSLVFHQLGGDILATYTMSDSFVGSLDAGLVAISRPNLSVVNVYTMQAIHTEKTMGMSACSTRSLGELAINLAIQECCDVKTGAYESGRVGKNKDGAPHWDFYSGHDEHDNNKEIAISITHNKQHICGIALGK